MPVSRFVPAPSSAQQSALTPTPTPTSGVTLTVAQLAAALRVGDSAEETAEVTRLLAYATEAVTKQAPAAPDVVQNEAVVRLAGYLFDQPLASRASAYANAMRHSGAARILLPYRQHGAGSVADAEGA